MEEVYIVKVRDINDEDATEYIIGVCGSEDEALNMLKEEIKHIVLSYAPFLIKYYRYSIDKWTVGSRNARTYWMDMTEADNINIAKELGIYNE